MLSHQQGQTGRLQGAALLTAKFSMNHAPHDHKQPRPPSAWEGKSQGPQQLWGLYFVSFIGRVSCNPGWP